MTTVLNTDWDRYLHQEFDQPYMKQLRQFLQKEKEDKKIIYPPSKDIFRAFHATPLDQVSVVILGQDPYHGPNQANGLSFSVHRQAKIPPSLVNIYKEFRSDLGIEPPTHGCLDSWAEQGVLLLNSVLTVEQGQPASHQGKGWEEFTDKIIDLLNTQKKHLAFILWGAYAQKKGQFIDTNKHFVLTSPHPSPFSANKGFFGSRPFSRVNFYLKSKNLSPIDWRIV
jgi:uracil-DNA glycosylase